MLPAVLAWAQKMRTRAAKPRKSKVLRASVQRESVWEILDQIRNRAAKMESLEKGFDGKLRDLKTVRESVFV